MVLESVTFLRSNWSYQTVTQHRSCLGGPTEEDHSHGMWIWGTEIGYWSWENGGIKDDFAFLGLVSVVNVCMCFPPDYIGKQVICRIYNYIWIGKVQLNG